MELIDVVRALGKRWPIVFAAILLGSGLGLVVSLATTPLYQASTLVFVSVQSAGSVNELAQGSNFTQGQVKSYAEVVATPRVLEGVVRELGLAESTGQLAQSVSAASPNGTVNIEIAVVRDSPEEAAAIANAVTARFQQVISDITAPNVGGESPVKVSVLRSASVPVAPVSPSTALNVLFGALVGLAISVGVVLLLEVTNTRVNDERDIREATDAPLLGGIAYDKEAPRRPLIVHVDPGSMRAEAFRTLRTNLQFLDVEAGPRSFVVTSPLPREGKTVSTANLAIALAQAGRRVVVIDADMRRPSLADQFGLEGAVGLSDVLIGRVALTDALQPWGGLPIAVLPSGALPPNPSELLGSHAMEMVRQTLERDFDTVLFDAPPLLPVADAAILAKQTRGAILLAVKGRTRRAELGAAVRTLETVDARVAGIILSMVKAQTSELYGYSSGGYSSRPPAGGRTPGRVPRTRSRAHEG